MKAAIYRKYGPPEVLQIIETETPKPQSEQLQVRVKAAAVNRTDCANLTAIPFIMRFSLGLFTPKIKIPGTEFSGVVTAVGDRVFKFKVGDRVFGFSDSILSSYADYTVVSQDQGIATMPEKLSFIQAAASTEGFHYAYNFLNKVPLKPNDNVMLNGASGGIGSAMLQILKYHKARITATCTSKNMELIKSLGADKVIDYEKEDFTLDPEKYDYVFDSVGKSSFGKCKKLLKPGGAYISSELGWMAENLFYSLLTAIFSSVPFQGKRKVKFPYPPDILRSVLFAKKLFDEGHYQPVIDRTYEFNEIRAAYDYVLTGQKTGNVVVKIDENL
jgi:NADPH:quinone reductase-like Zn-dependent oxidoreductase